MSDKDTFHSETKNVMVSARTNIFRAGLNALDIRENITAKVLILGITSAGKSTMVEFLERGSIKDIKRKPTLSFQFHRFNFGKLKMQLIDVPGQRAYWKDWHKYTNRVDGIVFMIDSTDIKLMSAINAIIKQVLSKVNPEVPICFIANKQDEPGALPAETIYKLMRFGSLPNKADIFNASAITGVGLLQAFRWLLTNIDSRLRFSN
ncbi:MAG: GTP-binding protein [Candidatus Heimdallarchaeota archaeon]|nr:GTP-binding protein [Candidatus Heimdallarchaeota archaeon]